MDHLLTYSLLLLSSLDATQAKDELPAAIGPPPGSSPLSWGFYATHEIQEPTELEVEGTIPDWLTGSLYRGAAGTWDVGNFTAEHWFDGFSRNHRFEIANGVVSYRSRNATDELNEFVRETGLYPDGSFGTDPCKIIFGAMETTFRDGNEPKGDAATRNVGVAFIPNFAGLARNTTSTNQSAPFDTLVVTTDHNLLQQIDPVTLEPIELFTYQAANPLLVNSGRSAAHPYFADEGIFYNYLLDMEADPPVYRIFSMSPKGEATILANITDAPPAYLHSIFGTDDHLILIVWQSDFVNSGKTIMESLGPWDPDRKTLFYVIDRANGGVVSKYESEKAFFAFHSINSFEDETGDIYIDLPVMEDNSFLTAAHVENLRANLGSHNGSMNDLPGTFTRYRLPYKGDDAKALNGSLVKHTAEEFFTLPHKEANIELPRMNIEYYGRPYRYTYGIHVETPGNFEDSIIKIDTQTKEFKVWFPVVRSFTSEPIFVPTPGGECEDDGVLMTVIMDSEKRASSLVVIDAATMEEIGRANMPVAMGYGFHGWWGSA